MLIKNMFIPDDSFYDENPLAFLYAYLLKSPTQKGFQWILHDAHFAGLFAATSTTAVAGK